MMNIVKYFNQKQVRLQFIFEIRYQKVTSNFNSNYQNRISQTTVQFYFQFQNIWKSEFRLSISCDEEQTNLSSSNKIIQNENSQKLIQSISPQQNFQQPLNPKQLLKLYNQRYCTICKCIKRNRMKHCYSCGKCIMKQDHHCPWIGSCVGQLNHFKFVLCLLFHTLQSGTTFYICLESLGLYHYFDEERNSFSTEYGIFLIWSISMFLYMIFAGGLLAFHTYLVSANMTTRELMSRRKCLYLKDVKGNPFDRGFLQNFKLAINSETQGRLWLVEQETQYALKQKGFISKLFKNQYYQCC